MSDVRRRSTLYRYTGNISNEMRTRLLASSAADEIGPDRCAQRKDPDRAEAVKAQWKRISKAPAKRRRS